MSSSTVFLESSESAFPWQMQTFGSDSLPPSLHICIKGIAKNVFIAISPNCQHNASHKWVAFCETVEYSFKAKPFKPTAEKYLCHKLLNSVFPPSVCCLLYLSPSLKASLRVHPPLHFLAQITSFLKTWIYGLPIKVG